MAKEEQSLDESDAALMSISKTLIEILLTANIVKPRLLDRMLAEQRDSYLAKKMPIASGMLEHMRLFATDPARERHRETLRQILQQSPKGAA